MGYTMRPFLGRRGIGGPICTAAVSVPVGELAGALEAPPTLTPKLRRKAASEAALGAPYLPRSRAVNHGGAGPAKSAMWRAEMSARRRANSSRYERVCLLATLETISHVASIVHLGLPRDGH